jgi:hypothetical protein
MPALDWSMINPSRIDDNCTCFFSIQGEAPLKGVPASVLTTSKESPPRISAILTIFSLPRSVGSETDCAKMFAKQKHKTTKKERDIIFGQLCNCNFIIFLFVKSYNPVIIGIPVLLFRSEYERFRTPD